MDALAAIGKVNSKAKADIVNGTLKVPKKDVIALGKLPGDEIARALKDIRMGYDWKESNNGTGTAPADQPDRIKAVFEQAEAWKRAVRALKLAATALAPIEASKLWKDLSGDKNVWHTCIRTRAMSLEQLLPTKVCGSCNGIEASEDNEPCAVCLGKGFLTAEEIEG